MPDEREDTNPETSRRPTVDKDTWLILPTFNERENIERLVQSAVAELSKITDRLTVLIVDDNSPDGTGTLADALAGQDTRITVLHRAAKQGLGTAYVAGFKVALEANAELIVQMDSDFSHDPAYLPELVMPVAEGRADLTLGSRYVAGGGVADWGPLRRTVSRSGCWYARHVLSIPVRDLTGGFKCFSRKLLTSIPLDSVQSQGYSFQVEMTYRTIMAGFRVLEVPIVFTERRAGSSKMHGRIVVEAAWVVPRLRFADRRGHGVNRSVGAGVKERED